jgi:hypothetical protein
MRTALTDMLGLDFPLVAFSHLPMPLMEMISDSAFRKIGQAAAAGSPEAYRLQSYFVGQAVGMLGSVRPAAEVVYSMIESYIEAVARLNEISADN